MDDILMQMLHKAVFQPKELEEFAIKHREELMDIMYKSECEYRNTPEDER